MSKQLTARQAREHLFEINTVEADELRKELFDVREQDAPLPGKYAARFEAVISVPRLIKGHKEPLDELVHQTILPAIEEDLNIFEKQQKKDALEYLIYKLTIEKNKIN